MVPNGKHKVGNCIWTTPSLQKYHKEVNDRALPKTNGAISSGHKGLCQLNDLVHQRPPRSHFGRVLNNSIV